MAVKQLMKYRNALNHTYKFSQFLEMRNQVAKVILEIATRGLNRRASEIKTAAEEECLEPLWEVVKDRRSYFRTPYKRR